MKVCLHRFIGKFMMFIGFGLYVSFVHFIHFLTLDSFSQFASLTQFVLANVTFLVGAYVHESDLEAEE